MREIRTYGLTREKSLHAPQKLRFGGYIAEGNPKGAQACARQCRGEGLYSTRKKSLSEACLWLCRAVWLELQAQ